MNLLFQEVYSTVICSLDTTELSGIFFVTYSSYIDILKISHWRKSLNFIFKNDNGISKVKGQNHLSWARGRWCLRLRLKLCMHSTSSPKKSLPWPHLACPKSSAEWLLPAVSYLPGAPVKTYLHAADYQYQKLSVPFPPYFYSQKLWAFYCPWLPPGEKIGLFPRRGPLNKHVDGGDVYSKLRLICISPFTGLQAKWEQLQWKSLL